MNNRVKEIRIYKNGEILNEHHNNHYKMKRYIEIEFFNNEIIRLDAEANADITNCDYIKIINKGKLIKTIFKNELA